MPELFPNHFPQTAVQALSPQQSPTVFQDGRHGGSDNRGSMNVPKRQKWEWGGGRGR